MGSRDADFRRQLPLDLDTFQNWQADECERAKQLLWGTWAPRTLELFRKNPPKPANGDLGAFWRCMCTLQVLKLNLCGCKFPCLAHRNREPF